MSLKGVLVHGYEQQFMERFYFATLQFERIKFNTDKFTQVVYYLCGVLSTSEIIWLFKDVTQTDRQTDIFSRLKISELGENSFILILLNVKVWSSHLKIRVWRQTCNYSES